jgi:hypothetical protein
MIVPEVISAVTSLLLCVLPCNRIDDHCQHCLDSRIIEDGEIVSLAHRPRSGLQKNCISVSDIHFY